MAESQEQQPRKARKSVSFNAGTTIMDADGNITEAPHNEDKTTAESHTAPVEQEIDEVTELFKGLTKKKKSIRKPETTGEGTEAADATPSADNPEFAKVRKTKKKTKKELDNFEAKLVAAGLVQQEEAETTEEKPPSAEEVANDMQNGRGIWAHDATTPLPYNLLVTRFYSLVSSNHPDLLLTGSRSYRIPPPQCLREGNKRTIFANIAEVCKRMNRTHDHTMQFMFAELGTSGSVDGSGRLVIKGRFQQKQIENVLRRYIVEYVTCKTCRSPDTELNKGENRLYFVTCNSCGSRRSVAAIKYGFRGQVGRRKRQG